VSAPLTTDEDALVRLLDALELPYGRSAQQGNPNQVASAEAGGAQGAGGGGLPPRLLRMLRDATATYCAG
jgi:hypothetical protein